jgi:hypothetical protein
MEAFLRSNGVFISLLCVLLCSVGFCAGYGGGTGNSGDPYLISTAQHLQNLSANAGDWGQCFKLTTDVSASLYTPVTSFTGVFDGNGHSITGFSCSTGSGYVGFFGKIQGATARVKNLTIVSPAVNVSTVNYVGAIAGSLENGAVISGCSVSGGSVTGYNQTGGIAGSNNGGSMLGCSSSTAVSGHSYVGGLAGRNEQNSGINDCYATGQVSAGGDYCGGIVGSNLGAILRCMAGGDAVGYSDVGGLLGCNGESSYAGQVSRSFAVGQASGACCRNSIPSDMQGGLSCGGCCFHFRRIFGQKRLRLQFHPVISRSCSDKAAWTVALAALVARLVVLPLVWRSSLRTFCTAAINMFCMVIFTSPRHLACLNP